MLLVINGLSGGYIGPISWDSQAEIEYFLPTLALQLIQTIDLFVKRPR